ncbi:65-kDa microtubule-associated protein 6 [Hibiscus syriacus]|uniref:65-kDa microtubule-associated protein 6 n=1 Tax=Hibiscus syriacus TaxID=106335 RepID=A0A6A2YAJ7_HIBSY|nr:65-kDa microtubule-associated protein 6 [Hibiscus syriacus]
MKASRRSMGTVRTTLMTPAAQECSATAHAYGERVGRAHVSIWGNLNVEGGEWLLATVRVVKPYLPRIVSDVHPSLQRTNQEQSTNISNGAFEGLAQTINKLKTERRTRILKLRDVAAELFELWNLMDSPEAERNAFSRATSILRLSEPEITEPGVLSTEMIEQASAEVERLTKLKASRMKELVMKRRAELEDICRKIHIEPDASTSVEKSNALIDSGLVDPSELLANIEAQITKAKDEALNRKEIMDRIDRLLVACEEENWLEDYNQDVNRYNAGRGAHINLKRAEKARITVTKIPAIVDDLINRTLSWEEEKKTLCLYDGVLLVWILEDYKLTRKQKEEEKKRCRDQKKIQDLLLTEREAIYGSKPSPRRSNSFRKTVGYRANGNGSMTPSTPRRSSVGGATPDLLTPRSYSGRQNGYFKEKRRLSTAPLNFVAITKEDAVSTSRTGQVTDIRDSIATSSSSGLAFMFPGFCLYFKKQQKSGGLSSFNTAQAPLKTGDESALGNMKLWKKAVGAIKDKNSIVVVYISRRHSFRNPDLEAAIIKATSHDEYCIDKWNAQVVFSWIRTSPFSLLPIAWALSRRMEKTRSWVVAIKGLMLMHGVFHCKVPVVEMMPRLPFDLSSFSDGHSKPNKSWGFNSIIREYFAFLDQKAAILFDQDNNKRKGEDRSLMVQQLLRLQTWQSLLDSLLQIKPGAENMKVRLILEAMDCVIVEIFDVYGIICSDIAKIPEEEVKELERIIDGASVSDKTSRDSNECFKKKNQMEMATVLEEHTKGTLKTIITDKWVVFDEENININKQQYANEIKIVAGGDVAAAKDLLLPLFLAVGTRVSNRGRVFDYFGFPVIAAVAGATAVVADAIAAVAGNSDSDETAISRTKSQSHTVF